MRSGAPLLGLAKYIYYIHVKKVLSKEGSPFFHHFNEAPYQFKVAIGADGAPFGKDDEAPAASFFYQCRRTNCEPP